MELFSGTIQIDESIGRTLEDAVFKTTEVCRQKNVGC